MMVFIFLSNGYTYSFFKNAFNSEVLVQSASAEGLIKHVEIIDNSNGSKVIQITRDSEYGYRPDVGFSIEGDLAEYIVHMNPVTVDVNGVYEIPIVPNINAMQFLKLLWLQAGEREEQVTGILTVKNFDGNTIASEKVGLDIEYLLGRINAQIAPKQNVTPQKLGEEVALKEMTSLITYLASQVNWKEDESKIDSEKVQTLSKQPPVSKLEITPYQEEIIKSILPELRSHLENLYMANENLIWELDEKESEITTLNSEIDQLSISNSELIKQLNIIENEYRQMQDSYNNQLQELTEENTNLKNRKDSNQDQEEPPTGNIDNSEQSNQGEESDEDDEDNESDEQSN